MTTATILAAVLTLSSVVATGASVPQSAPSETPTHQVVAIYFHRTVRCPTCQRIGAMAEEAVTQGFEQEMKAGTVDFRLVDFQNKQQDQEILDRIKACRVETPTLVLLNVFADETVCWTPLPKVWQLVGKPDEFRNYVRAGVADYLQQTPEEAAQQRGPAKEFPE